MERIVSGRLTLDMSSRDGKLYIIGPKEEAAYFSSAVSDLLLEIATTPTTVSSRGLISWMPRGCFQIYYIHALVNFYNDHKKVRKNLDIKVRRFVACAYFVARENDAKFVLNDKLKYAMFG
ncbi:hypothetical protein CAEBREN_04496 [Caenorhabditis brenneri]|uniref:Uncharacterized protein n=1 Tax=Caenorhabditis brenneri TaxID=135651 RepID=G0N6C6_CAEBE|nr:hypothetical protein CAEBREN_04496 [Caenorhabditis brenneri]